MSAAEGFKFANGSSGPWTGDHVDALRIGAHLSTMQLACRLHAPVEALDHWIAGQDLVIRDEFWAPLTAIYNGLTNDAQNRCGQVLSDIRESRHRARASKSLRALEPLVPRQPTPTNEELSDAIVARWLPINGRPRTRNGLIKRFRRQGRQKP